MAVFMNDALPKFDGADLKTTVKRLHDYANALSEQLRFVLANLDEDNVPALSVLNDRVSDALGNFAELSLSAEGLISRVESAEGSLSALQQTAEGLTTRVENAEGEVSAVTETAGRLESRVQTAEGCITVLIQDTNGLTTRVENAEGSVSTMQQTATGLESRVSDLDGKYTSIKQSVDSIDVEGTVNSIMQDGVAEINFLDGRETIGFIRATDNGVLNVAGQYDVAVNSGDRILLNSDTQVWGGLRIYLGTNKYWEFGTDGIHYHSAGGESVTVMNPI